MTSTDGNWRERAACSTARLMKVAPELAHRAAEAFFPVGSEDTAENKRAIAQAKAVCAGCPVKAECLDDALAAKWTDGVFGGLSAAERRQLGRTKRAVA
ncbi:WhiB family transcriptional regulator [Amycolatopsis keratiniphila]|nr:WhiB family transcriptional regulator [Amycolatopsis keratiniphila]